MSRSKWKRERQATQDLKQTLLAPSKPSGIKIRTPPITVKAVIYSGKFFCPFCLHIGPLSDFRVRTKKGWSEKKAKCPDCGNGMMMRTLTRTMSIEEYAEWVFMYSLSGFWQKCSFKKFCRRLKKLGWSYRFWGKYKALKGEATEETYHEYMDRKQEEYAREEGWIK